MCSFTADSPSIALKVQLRDKPYAMTLLTIFDGGRPFACGDGVVDTDQGETCDDGTDRELPHNSSCSICNSVCILEPITGPYWGMASSTPSKASSATMPTRR